MPTRLPACILPKTQTNILVIQPGRVAQKANRSHYEILPEPNDNAKLLSRMCPSLQPLPVVDLWRAVDNGLFVMSRFYYNTHTDFRLLHVGLFGFTIRLNYGNHPTQQSVNRFGRFCHCHGCLSQHTLSGFDCWIWWQRCQVSGGHGTFILPPTHNFQ